jgi:Ca-activated chloride channel family protein
MYGFPLEVSKTILHKLLLSLRPTDIFNVMLFEFSRKMFSDKSLPATPANIEKALQLIGAQEGRGGTNLYQALQAAFDFQTTPDFARTFVIATDGYVTIENKAFQLVENQRDKANLFALGIGSDVNRHLIEGLAYSGAGEAYIITNQTEAETVGAKLINDITMPLWSHIQVDWGKLDVQDVEPVSVPDLFATKPVIIYGKYKGNPAGTITLRGKTATGDFEQTIQTDNVEMTQSEALRYLWARNRIKYLSDYASYFEDGVEFIYQRETPKHQQHITELGLKYNLLTKYTSFLAVDDEVRAPQKELMESDALFCCCEEIAPMYMAEKSRIIFTKGLIAPASYSIGDEDRKKMPSPCIKREIKREKPARKFPIRLVLLLILLVAMIILIHILF